MTVNEYITKNIENNKVDSLPHMMAWLADIGMQELDKQEKLKSIKEMIVEHELYDEQNTGKCTGCFGNVCRW